MQTKEMIILNSREVREIEDMIKNNHGCEINLRKFLVMKDFKNGIWLASENVASHDLHNLQINSIGVNIGRIKKDKMNLTIEGCQMIGKNAGKNIVFVREAEEFMKGKYIEDFEEVQCRPENYVIVRTKEDILGMALLREKKLKNLLPRSRRI